MSVRRQPPPVISTVISPVSQQLFPRPTNPDLVQYKTADLKVFATTANRILENLWHELPRGTNAQFVFVNASGGIGVLEIQLLQRKDVARIYTFEGDAERHQRLVSNLRAHQVNLNEEGVSADSRVVVINAPFMVDTLGDLSGSIFFFDQLWGAIDVNVLAPARAESLLLVLRSLGDPPWPETKTFTLQDSRLFVYEGGRYESINESLSIGDFGNQAQIMLRQQQSALWKDEFREFIRRTLYTYQFTAEEVEPLLNHLDLWIRAFTNKSFDPVDNYETLEIVGDNVLSAAFVDYLYSINKHLSPDQVTQLKRAYMSGEEHEIQQQLAERLGFGQYLRYIAPDLSPKFLEDVFESFFGALVEAAELEQMSGYELAKRILIQIVGPIDFGLAREPDKSIVYAIFSQMRWNSPGKKGGPVVITNQTDEDTRVEIQLNNEAKAYFTKMHMRIPQGGLLGQGVAETKKEAQRLAFHQALETLARLGITHTSAKEHKDSFIYRNDEFKRFIPYVQGKLRRAGYTKIEFDQPNIGTFQIIGVDGTGMKKVIYSAAGKNPTEGYRNLFTGYMKE